MKSGIKRDCRFINQILFTLIVAFNAFSLPLLAKKEKWVATSGRWNNYQLDNGNKVLRQSWRHDRKKTDAPLPYHMYKTIHIHKNYDPRYATEAKFDFKIQSFYSSTGEVAIFFGGKSIKEVYFIRLQFHKKFIYNISLLKTEIRNPDFPEKVFGNFYTNNLSSGFASIPTKNMKSCKIIRSKRGIRLFINGKNEFSYTNSSRGKWTFYPKTFFAIGSRGANIWIDNVIISRNGKILFRDDFSKDNVKRYRLTIRPLTSKDKSTPTSPR